MGWFFCTVLTDLCVIFSQKVIHKLYNGQVETLSSTLQRLWKPHGHAVPRLWIKDEPAEPPPPLFSADAEQIRGHGVFNTEQLTGMLYASFAVVLAFYGVLGSLGW